MPSSVSNPLTSWLRGVRRRVVWAAGFGVLLVLLASLGSAQEIIELHDGTLHIEASFPLPAEISRGLAPLFVDLENESEEERRVEIVFEPQQWNFDCRVSQTVTVPAAGSLRAELLVPAWTSFYGGRIKMTSGRDSSNRWLQTDVGQAGGLVEAVVLVTDRTVSATQLEAWTETLARAEVQIDGKAVRNVSIGTLEAADLPRRFESFSGVAAVVIDADARIADTQLAPILRWCRLGGALIFNGPDARTLARTVPDLVGWMEPRFALQGPTAGSVGSGSIPAEYYQLGLGVLVIVESSEVLDPNQSEAFRWGTFDHADFVPRRGHNTVYLRELDIPGVKELPYRLFIVLLVIFCALIGPINFTLVKKAGRPAWLLFTIPFLALIACMGFLAYGIFYQGVDLREASETFTLLDQREHRSNSIALRSIFAGLSPADGLHPEPGTVVFPALGTGDSTSTFYGIEMGSELTLTGEFLPVRKEGTQLVLSESSARGRLQFRRGASGSRGFQMTNGFSVPVLSVCLSDSDGTRHLFRGTESDQLGPGASVPLVRSTGMQGAVDLTTWLPDDVLGRDLGWAEDLPPGTYLALLETNPFVDGCGLEPDRAAGRHAILGVLPVREPAAGESWE